MSQLQETNQTLDFFCDFDKISANVAEVEMSSKSGKGFFTSDHFYRVTADEADLDLAFLVTFAIARTEQMFYS